MLTPEPSWRAPMRSTTRQIATMGIIVARMLSWTTLVIRAEGTWVRSPQRRAQQLHDGYASSSSHFRLRTRADPKAASLICRHLSSCPFCASTLPHLHQHRVSPWRHRMSWHWSSTPGMTRLSSLRPGPCTLRILSPAESVGALCSCIAPARIITLLAADAPGAAEVLVALPAGSQKVRSPVLECELPQSREPVRAVSSSSFCNCLAVARHGGFPRSLRAIH